MKKLTVIAALTLASASGFASKARYSSLAESFHVLDHQTIFLNPVDITEFGDWATFEFGGAGYTESTNAAATGQHEGGFARSMGDARWGLYLNHKDSRFVTPTRAALGYLTQQNPIDFFYGMKADMKWSVNLEYSDSNKKSTDQKQTAATVRAGVRTGNDKSGWDAFIQTGLINKADGTLASTSAKMTGKMGLFFGGGYTMETLYFFGNYQMRGFKSEDTATGLTSLDVSANDLQIGVVDSLKKDGTDFFYGVTYKNSTVKNGSADVALTNEAKVDRQNLPVHFAIEHEAAPWLVLRASFIQNILLGSYKGSGTAAALGGTATANNADSLEESQTLGAGLGLKFGKMVIDGSFKAALGTVNNNGDFGSDNNFLTQTSMTYTF